MSKLTELFLGLCGVAGIGMSIWLGITEDWGAGIVFFIFQMLFLSLIARIFEISGNLIERVFNTRS